MTVPTQTVDPTSTPTGDPTGDPTARPTSDAVPRVSAATDDALGTSDLTDLRDRLARREVSAAELRSAALARAQAINGEVNGVTQWVDEPAQTEVRVAPEAPLAGIPTVLKDNEQLAGFATTFGSRAMPSIPNKRCSPFVTHFLELGLDPIATTTLPEFGLTATTETTRFGATRNPWDTRRSVGGSSGGSAALLAAGVVPLVHGNDGGGSIRIPASCCGVVGLKPSRGRLPDSVMADHIPVPITVQGVLTRTVRDTALYYALAERSRPADHLPPIGHVTEPSGKRLRIGVCTDLILGLQVSPDALAATQRAAQVCEAAGHSVVPVGLPVTEQFVYDFLMLWSVLAFSIHRGGRYAVDRSFDTRAVEPITRELSRRMVRRIERVPGALRRLLARAARSEGSTWGEYDVLLTPVTHRIAPPIGHMGPQVDGRTHLIRLLQFCALTSVQNVSGDPAISLPLGRTADGFPIGVQFAAPLGHERQLLELALELEEAAPWPLTPTPTPASAPAGMGTAS